MADGSEISPPSLILEGSDPLRSPLVDLPKMSQAVKSGHKRKASRSSLDGSPASRPKSATPVQTQTSSLCSGAGGQLLR